MTRRDWIWKSSTATAAMAIAGCHGQLEGGPDLAEGAQLPRFHARTLTGQVFDNARVKDKVLLLQFWATWCGYCRREQTPLDRITKEFEARGLIVLAVNVGESRDKVVEYLREKPRACHVVMQSDTNLASIFHAEGFPKYVAVNRAGLVAGNQDGAGGALALRDLLSGAGLRA